MPLHLLTFLPAWVGSVATTVAPVGNLTHGSVCCSAPGPFSCWNGSSDALARSWPLTSAQEARQSHHPLTPQQQKAVEAAADFRKDEFRALSHEVVIERSGYL